MRSPTNRRRFGAELWRRRRSELASWRTVPADYYDRVVRDEGRLCVLWAEPRRYKPIHSRSRRCRHIQQTVSHHSHTHNTCIKRLSLTDREITKLSAYHTAGFPAKTTQRMTVQLVTKMTYFSSLSPPTKSSSNH